MCMEENISGFFINFEYYVSYTFVKSVNSWNTNIFRLIGAYVSLICSREDKQNMKFWKSVEN
jgi:hypothetical protein